MNAVIAYIPPPRFINMFPMEFIQNLRENPTKNELILISDHDYSADVSEFATFRMLKASPDAILKKRIGDRRKTDIPNFVWFSALRVAFAHGVKNLMFIESDCRVLGAGWDEAMFDEFLSSTRAPLFGGSIVGYNISNAGRAALERAYDFIHENRRKNPFPIPVYGFKSAAENVGSCVFPNGAGTIASMEAYKMLFTPEEFERTPSTSFSMNPFDQEIGFRLWTHFGMDVYSMLLHMKTQYSAYGDVLSTEESRRELLTSGKVKLIHQVKSGWVPKVKVKTVVPERIPEIVSEAPVTLVPATEAQITEAPITNPEVLT